MDTDISVYTLEVEKFVQRLDDNHITGNPKKEEKLNFDPDLTFH